MLTPLQTFTSDQFVSRQQPCFGVLTQIFMILLHMWTHQKHGKEECGPKNGSNSTTC